MTAATVAAPGRLEMRTVPVPVPRPAEVLVRLEGTGVCASNVPPWEGKPWFHYPMEPGALGHEGWGRVAAVGSEVNGLSPGDRVAMLSGHAYAEYDVAPVSSVARLPETLDRAPFPGEPLGCAMNIFARSGIARGHSVAIVGIGFLGALLTQLADAVGARVVAISRRAFALAFATKMGATLTLGLEDAAATADQVRQWTDGAGCDVVVEATGKQGPLDLAAELTRERGRLVIAGYHQDGPRQVNMQLWNWRGLDVINAHERDPAVYLHGMQAAIAAVSEGRLDPSALYTHRFPLARLDEALRMTAERPDGFMKALVEA